MFEQLEKRLSLITGCEYRAAPATPRRRASNRAITLEYLKVVFIVSALLLISRA